MSDQTLCIAGTESKYVIPQVINFIVAILSVLALFGLIATLRIGSIKRDVKELQDKVKVIESKFAN